MREGANGGSIFDCQRERRDWDAAGEIRDAGPCPLGEREAALPDGQEGVVEHSLDYYEGQEIYYWRLD
jgi:hypothetical protein